MATDLIIVPDSASSDHSSRPSTVPLSVDDGELHLPRPLVEFLQRRNVVSAGGFLSFLRSTPDPLGIEFGWDPSSIHVLLTRL